MKNKIDYDYLGKIKEESSLWNKAAEDELKKGPPDYSYYKKTWPYLIYRNPFVIKMLNKISEGDRVLELGCYNGWFSLEMARKGANVEAYDISQVSIGVAKKYYGKCKKIEKLTGSISYHIADLNYPNFPNNNYDKIVIRNVLHHLINLDLLYKKLFSILKPKGLILIDDALPVRKFEALITGVLLFILPTDIPYSQKINRVFKNGNIIKRTQDLVDSKDSSPFEGITGEESLNKIKLLFPKNKIITYSAFVGAITPRLQLPLFIKSILLKILNFFDYFMINVNLMRGTVYYFFGQKS